MSSPPSPLYLKLRRLIYQIHNYKCFANKKCYHMYNMLFYLSIFHLRNRVQLSDMPKLSYHRWQLCYQLEIQERYTLIPREKDTS